MNEVQEQKKGVIEINKSRMQLMFTTRARVCVCVCVCVFNPNDLLLIPFFFGNESQMGRKCAPRLARTGVPEIRRTLFGTHNPRAERATTVLSSIDGGVGVSTD